MFRCYLKTCSVPLEHIIRVNHCLQLFSYRVKFIKMSFNKVIINPLCCLYPALWHPVNDNAPSEMIRKRWILTQTHTGAAFSPCGSMWVRIITKSFHFSCLLNDHDYSGKTALTIKISKHLLVRRTLRFCWVLNWIL